MNYKIRHVSYKVILILVIIIVIIYLIECFLYTKPYVENDIIPYWIYFQTTKLPWMELVIEQRSVITRLYTPLGPNPVPSIWLASKKCIVK